MTVLCICWLKLQKLNYNARNAKYRIVILLVILPKILVTHIQHAGDGHLSSDR